MDTDPGQGRIVKNKIRRAITIKGMALKRS